MRLATWNINGMRARLEFIKLWLAERQPDVVGLQELKMTDDKFPHADFEAVGYHALTHGQPSWNGVAILSREPAEATQVGLPGQEELGARLLTAKVAGVSFTTVYCPNGKHLGHADFLRKLAWFDALRAHLAVACTPSEPAVLCGDFNICPGPLDSWNEAGMAGNIFHTDDERSRFQGLLDLGFHDLYRELEPTTPGFTWWDYRAGAFHKKQGLRIDAILGTAPVRQRLAAACPERDWRKKHEGLTASDHAPLYVDIAYERR